MALVKNIFVAGGMPSVTYVDRAALALEKTLTTEINEGYKVICVTGPTKSGKTVLTRHVLGEENSATVNGGQVSSSVEFWTSLLHQLNLPETESGQESAEGIAGFNYIFQAQAKISEGSIQTFNNNNKRTILQFLTTHNLALVVDDFHYLPVDVQREIVRSLKSEVFDGLTAILIAVPHRAFDAIGVEREMEGRFAHVPIPSWDQEELLQVSAQGFPELNMFVDPSCTVSFAQEANGSPLLMQRFCNRLCGHYGVTETLPEMKEFRPSDEVRKGIYEKVAQQFGFPTFDRLSRGPQSRSDRMGRHLIDGSGTLDIYEAVLRAVALTGPKEKIHYNDIRDQLRLILVEGDIPQKHEVSSCLRHMQSIAQEHIKGEPVLEWSDDYLYLTDPFLMFYMRWAEISNNW